MAPLWPLALALCALGAAKGPKDARPQSADRAKRSVACLVFLANGIPLRKFVHWDGCPCLLAQSGRAWLVTCFGVSSKPTSLTWVRTHSHRLIGVLFSFSLVVIIYQCRPPRDPKFQTAWFGLSVVSKKAQTCFGKSTEVRPIPLQVHMRPQEAGSPKRRISATNDGFLGSCSFTLE